MGVSLAACGSSGTEGAVDEPQAAPTTESPSTTVEPATSSTQIDTDSTPTTNSDATEASDSDSAGSDPAVIELSGQPVEISSEWQLLERRFFVYGVEADDQLNVRAEPSISADAIGSIDPFATQVGVFDEVSFWGDSRWSPIQVEGGAGWVNLDFLRPHPGLGEVEIRGDASDPMLAVARETIEALGSPDFLATMVGPKGLTISPDAYIETIAQGAVDLVISSEQLSDNGEESLLWGYSDGSGEPIEGTLQDQLDSMLGATALTSTEIISVQNRVGLGNSIDNLSDIFESATIIEFHFSGTDYYSQLDWSSIRLAFEPSDADGEYYLVAIVEDRWTI